MLEESASAIPSSSIWTSMNSWFTPTVLFVFLNIMIGTIVYTSSLANNQKQQQTQENDDNHSQHQNDINPQQQQQPNIVRSPSVLQRLKSINLYRSQEPQTVSVQQEENPDSETLFNNENAHLITQSHDYFFQDTSPENLDNDPQSQAQYVFEGTHENSPQEIQAHYVFEESTHENSPEEIQDQFVFEENIPNFDGFQEVREEKVEENEQGMGMDEVYSELTAGNHFSRTKSDTVPASGEILTKLPAKMRKSASMKSAFGHFEEGDIVEARRPATVRETGSAKVTDGDEEVDAKADDFINKFKQQLKLQRLDSIIRYKDMIGRGSAVN